nr:ABC-F family ATP-binding cassette domain-containing protein [Peptoniphilus sp. KCTC 25270]
MSFRIEAGEKVGLIGNNGTGKTTLMEILADIIGKDSGEVRYQKDLEIGYLSQHATVEDEATVYDSCMENFRDLIELEKQLRNMEEEMSHLQGDELEIHMNRYSRKMEYFEEKGGYGRESAVRGTLIGLGFKESEFSQKASTLSGGQKSRLALAKLLLRKPDLLLLDEPTNHLDIDAITWLEKFLVDFKGALLLISHDRYFLDRIVNRILLLENKKLYSYNGDYSTYVVKRKRDLEERARAYANQQKEIKRQEEIIKRYTSWNRERSLKAARSRQKMLDKIERIEDVEHTQSAKIYFEPRKPSGKDVLLVENLTKEFPDKPLFTDISFPIYKGERVGLIGPNGVGKTTLLRILRGEAQATRGEFHLGTGVEMAYFDQEMINLDDSKTVMEEIWDKYPQLDHYQIRTYLAQFLFTGDDLLKQVGDLSGGEKGRLSLLELMLSQGNFLLLDEPTNHLDIDSKEILEEALNKYTGTILTISHDRCFLNNVATKIIALGPEGILLVEGNYDYYLQKLEELKEPEKEEMIKTRTDVDREKKESREQRKEKRKQQALLRDLEGKISELEESIETLDEQLANPSTYDDHEAALNIHRERENLQKELDEVYGKWVESMEE